jgi:hypothetical protein
MAEHIRSGSPGTPRVTVVLPLFGGHRAAQTLPAVVRAWLGQDVPCEVVVAIAGGVEVDLDERAVADGRLRIIRVPASMGSPGRLRNVAARTSLAPLLYLSDADIVPIGSGYLAGAVDMLDGGTRIFVQPWLYRLVSGPDWRTVEAWTPPSGKACFVTSDRDGVLTPLPGERFVRADRGLVRLPRGLERESDPWEQRILTNHHWGGVLLELHRVCRVGLRGRRPVDQIDQPVADGGGVADRFPALLPAFRAPAPVRRRRPDAEPGNPGPAQGDGSGSDDPRRCPGRRARHRIAALATA